MSILISGANSTVASQSSPAINSQQRQQSFKNLFAALQAGDLGAAQTAYAQLTGSTTPPTGTSNSTANANSPLAQIGQALQNGDLAGAQKAAQAFQSGHGHHHHHGGGQSSTASAASLLGTQAANSSTGSAINTTA
jgi:hypothetical protein